MPVGKGRLAEEKKITVLFDAVAKLKKTIPHIILAVVGQGAAENMLRKRAQSMQLEKNIRFFGFVPDETLPLLYHASDVFAIASTAETQCMSAMQAFACAVPVVAVAAWGLKEYIAPNAGFLIAPGDANALAEKILFFYEHPEIRMRMGETGRRYVEQFSPDRIATQWENIYREFSAAPKRGIDAMHVHNMPTGE